MSSLKQSIFWVAFYLVAIVVLAQFDYGGAPIVDFAKYFYMVSIVVIPATVFFPAIAKVSVNIPMIIWGCIYLAMIQLSDRSASAPNGSAAIILLEFILVEAGAWLGYQLAFGISHAESLMDALALSAFPNDVHNIDLEEKRIKIELTRSRRYNRPLGLVVIEVESEDRKATRVMLKSVQQDLLNRFTLARVGQIVYDHIRQTDFAVQDHFGRFIVLCPETNLQDTILFGARIAQTVKARTDFYILWGAASFPDEALTFDDLLYKARERLARSIQPDDQKLSMAEFQSEVRS